MYCKLLWLCVTSSVDHKAKNDLEDSVASYQLTLQDTSVNCTW